MQILRMPSLGETMEWGIITKWFKGEGESFDVGDELYEVETEKVTVPVEAMTPGTIARVVAPLDQEVPVGSVVAVVVEPGEQPSNADIDGFLVANAPSRAAPSPGPADTTSPGPAPPSASARGERVRAMPKSRAMARELGIDLATVTGTGRAGIITPDDVDAAALAAPQAVGPAVAAEAKLSGIPRAMAKSMASSWREIPHFTQTALVDATGLLARRDAERGRGVDVSLNDLLVAAVVAAVRSVPEVNVSLQGNTLIRYEDINVSIAVDTPEGLVAPVVKGAQDLELVELATETKRLGSAARDRELELADLSGGTITVSNLGMFGVDYGTPIVTQPQAAIVFAGSIKDRPVVDAGQVTARPTVHITVAFDHRAVDGATGARFLAAVVDEVAALS